MDNKLKEKYIRHGCGSVVEIIEKLESQVPKWFSVEDGLPDAGVLVLVYSPKQPGDYDDSVRISFDFIDPDSDGSAWYEHGEHYEHFCCIAGPGDFSVSGPSEKAPYTHWMPLPPLPEPPEGDTNE